MTAKLVESLNFVLDDLLVSEHRLNAESLNDSTGFGPDFIIICSALLERLSYYDAQVQRVGPNATIQEVFDSLRPRGPHFTLDSDIIKYRIIQFLCTNLQVRATTLF